MTNKKALRLIELGLHPVLLGREGDDLKRPLRKGWQTAVYAPGDVACWPSRNNIGIRCGRQRNGRFLAVLDFDEEADDTFLMWLRMALEALEDFLPLIVISGRGYHTYMYTSTPQTSHTLAGRYSQQNGRTRLHKYIEILGEGRQVVSAGSLHPSGARYHFLTEQENYTHIPSLSDEAFALLVDIARIFEERPLLPDRREKIQAPALADDNAVEPILKLSKGSAQSLAGVRNCLDYARRFIGAAEQVERNGDIRILGYGGLLLTADGRGWYSFSEETGGGLAELIAWHQSLVGEGA